MLLAAAALAGACALLTATEVASVQGEEPTKVRQKKPLSDSKISQILGQQGIVVARRTIAKYRESMHIPPVNLRKSL